MLHSVVFDLGHPPPHLLSQMLHATICESIAVTSSTSDVVVGFERGRVQSVLRLLADGAEVNAFRTEGIKAGETPLMTAARVGASEAIVHALLAAHADANAMNDSGETAMFIAVTESRLALVQVLLKSHALYFF